MYILKADDFSIFLNSSLRRWEFPRRATLENLIFSPNKQIAQGTHMSISWVAELEIRIREGTGIFCAGGRYIPTLHNPALVSPSSPLRSSSHSDHDLRFHKKFARGILSQDSRNSTTGNEYKWSSNVEVKLKLKFISPVLQFPKKKRFLPSCVVSYPDIGGGGHSVNVATQCCRYLAPTTHTLCDKNTLTQRNFTHAHTRTQNQNELLTFGAVSR